MHAFHINVGTSKTKTDLWYSTFVIVTLHHTIIQFLSISLKSLLLRLTSTLNASPIATFSTSIPSLWLNSHTICSEFMFELTVSFPFLHTFHATNCIRLCYYYFSDSKQNTTRKKEEKEKQVNLFKVNLFCCLSWSPFKKYPEYIMHLNLNLSMRKRYEEWSMW